MVFPLLHLGQKKNNCFAYHIVSSETLWTQYRILSYRPRQTISDIVSYRIVNSAKEIVSYFIGELEAMVLPFTVPAHNFESTLLRTNPRATSPVPKKSSQNPYS